MIVSEKLLESYEKEIKRLRSLVGHYAGFYDAVKDHPECIEKLLAEYNDKEKEILG